MINYKRTNLLKHELTKKLLDVKWYAVKHIYYQFLKLMFHNFYRNRIGSYVFYLNLVLYLLFVFGLTSYILNLQPSPELRYQNGKFLGLINPIDINKTSLNITNYERMQQVHECINLFQIRIALNIYFE